MTSEGLLVSGDMHSVYSQSLMELCFPRAEDQTISDIKERNDPHFLPSLFFLFLFSLLCGKTLNVRSTLFIDF